MDHRSTPPPERPLLRRAPKPPGLWDTVQAQVDRAFADFLGGDYTAPDWPAAAADRGDQS